jgi:outer membrane protein OmpA-like peptidoglycan-associated protein
MKKIFIAAMAALMMVTTVSCNLNNTAKGSLIGGASGTALGTAVGALIGNKTGNTGKGAAIGAAVGVAVGAGAGALIGNYMDKQKKELESQLADAATVEETTDANGLTAIKVTFDGGILFATGKSTLNTSAKTSLTNFATNLKSNVDTNVQIYGYTDNTGSLEANTKVSNNRANAVKDYLSAAGVASSRLSAEGLPMQDYVASNDTEAGRAQNRRVEIYISANETMIQKAEAGTL